MTTHNDRPAVPDAAMPVTALPASGPGNAFPATASGVPLSVYAFGFSVGVLGLVETGILSSAALAMFTAVALGTGAVGLLVGGLWDFRGGNLFAGTFGVAYALFLFTTGLILKFFAPGVIATAGAGAFGDAFGAWLILWAIFTAMLTFGARTVNLPAFLAFVLLIAVYVVLAIANLGGSAGWVDGVTKAGGWLALADGAVAWYLGTGILLNVMTGRDMLPLWPYHPRTTG